MEYELDNQTESMIRAAMGLPPSLEEQQARLTRCKELTQAFAAWLSANAELVDGMAIAFGCSPDGDSCSSVVGGQSMNSPAFDKIILRLAYNVESERESEYTTISQDYDIRSNVPPLA